MAIRMVRHRVGVIEVLVPAGLEDMTLRIVRAPDESDADYFAAVAMYQGLFGDTIYVGDEDMTIHHGSGDFLADMGYENPAETRADFLATNSVETAVEDGVLAGRDGRELMVEHAINDALRFGSEPSAFCREQLQLFVNGVIDAKEATRRVVHNQKFKK
jgi:hypothetical protein